MYCRKCGREIPDDSVMCGYCGTPTNPDNPYTYGGTPQNMDEGANGLGIASMILGIVAILLACCAGGKWLTFLVAAAGLILGMALAGVICSVIALLMKIIVIILLGVGIGTFLYSHMFHF